MLHCSGAVGAAAASLAASPIPTLLSAPARLATQPSLCTSEYTCIQQHHQQLQNSAPSNHGIKVNCTQPAGGTPQLFITCLALGKLQVVAQCPQLTWHPGIARPHARDSCSPASSCWHCCSAPAAASAVAAAASVQACLQPAVLCLLCQQAGLPSAPAECHSGSHHQSQHLRKLLLLLLVQ